MFLATALEPISAIQNAPLMGTGNWQLAAEHEDL